MTRRLLIIASLFALAVPTALAAPPADKGKPDNPGTSTSPSSQSAEKNAAKACKAELKSMGETKFADTYGTNKNKKNAFGKCVSGKAKSLQKAADEAQKAQDNAAKQCKAERKQLGESAFAAKYGTNQSKRNAFGKCVSSKSKSKDSSTSKNKDDEQDD